MPSRVAILKPNNAGNSSFLGSAVDDYAHTGGDKTTSYFMNVQRMGIRVGTQVAEVSGDGDALRRFEHSHSLNGSFQMSGFMISSAAVGLTGLDSATTNPCDIAVVLGRNGSDLRTLAFKGIIKDVSISWSMSGPFVGIQLSGIMTDSYSGQSDLVVESTAIGE